VYVVKYCDSKYRLDLLWVTIQYLMKLLIRPFTQHEPCELLGLGSVQQNSNSGLHYWWISLLKKKYWWVSEYSPARQQLFPLSAGVKGTVCSVDLSFPVKSAHNSSREPRTISMKSEFKVFFSFGILQVEMWKTGMSLSIYSVLMTVSSSHHFVGFVLNLFSWKF
jgi:hypothetical protein